MAIKVRDKGHGGEREFCRILDPVVGFSVERNVDQVRDGGADIIHIKPFAIEVKRQENLLVKQWWQQALSQRTKKNPFAVLVWRQNRRQWFCRVEARMICKGKMCNGEDWVEISLPHLLEIVKKRGKLLKS